MAYCTLANEILRHRNQADGSNNVSARPDRNLEPRTGTNRGKSLTCDETAAEGSPPKQRGRRRSSIPASLPDLSIVDRGSSTDIIRSRGRVDSLEPAPSPTAPRQKKSQPGDADPKPAAPQQQQHQRRGSMLRAGLIAFDQSSVLAALQQRAERDTARSPPATPRAQSVVSVNLDRRSHATTSRPPSRAPSRPPSRTPSRRPSLLEGGPMSPILSYFQNPETDQEYHEIGSLDDRLESKTLVSCPESPTDFMSPKSDTTMVEEPENYSPSHDKIVEDMRAYLPDYELGKPLKSPSIPSTPSPRRYAHQQRALSEDIVLSKGGRTSSVPFRSRAKTGNGMLELRANSGKDWTPTQSPMSAPHRRKMSLNIPVKAAIPESEVAHTPPMKTSRSDMFPRKHSPSTVTSTDLTKEERELSYKHRHTFIGTASLDDFLEFLEVSASYMTTKEAVAKAFILLSAHEQLYARQCSTSQEGWDLVHKIKPEDKYIDYLAQLQVKLGSITLRQFLGLIHFDDKDEVNAVRAVEAFSAASHLDSKAGSEMGSKAKAFRSWLLTQKDGQIGQK